MALILRSRLTSPDNRKFFATCCGMVEAPTRRRSLPKFLDW